MARHQQCPQARAMPGWPCPCPRAAGRLTLATISISFAGIFRLTLHRLERDGIGKAARRWGFQASAGPVADDVEWMGRNIPGLVDAMRPYPHLEDALVEGTQLDTRIQTRPNPFYRELRSRDPVHFDPQLNMRLLSRHEDLLTVTQDPITFFSERGYTAQMTKGFQAEFQAILREHGGGFFPDAIKTDPPYHTRNRKLLDSAFTAHRVRDPQPKITAVVREVIGEVAPAGEADGAREIAAPIPIRFICE